MRVAESQLLADRIAVALRWGIIFTFSLYSVDSSAASNNPTALLLIIGLWNLVLTAFTMLKLRMPYHPQVSVAIDFGFAILLFFLSGTASGMFKWIGFLPLVLACLYFGLSGGIFLAIINTLSQGLASMADVSAGDAFGLMVEISIGYLAVGVVLGFISQQLGYQLRHRQTMELRQQQEVERRERRRLNALSNITSTLTSTLNYQRVLDLALDLSVDALAEPSETAAHLVSAFLLFETDQLLVGSARRFTPADWRAALPGVDGLIGKAINSGRSMFAQDPSKDPELSRIIAFRSCQSAYCYPLRSGLDVYGVMIYGHPQSNFFDDSRRDILEIICQQAQVALENARLYRDLEEEKERMMSIQEEARKKLARNLHDGPTQSVAAIAMRVNFARRLMEKDTKSAGDELFKIEDLARRTTKEIRHMLFTLRPLVLESSGLKAALQAMAEKMAETFDENVIIEVEEEIVEKIEMGKQGVIFYIAEEAVNNARKHAEATSIWVRLKSGQQDLVLLEIEDNGVGFNIGAVDSGYEHRGSLGMVNMRERTELINGVLQLASKEGRGTRVRVWIPLTEEAADKIRRGG
ncbi:MAG: GAF domain-containing sensor histidine kinase [Chloroflexi bacterium]|nr:GAF domain-containing sensor histidine kinase [Chloroflexota bacterium]